MSRPGFPLFSLVQLRPDSLQLLGLMVATSFVVATLLAQCFSRIDVATTVSRRDLVVFPFFCILSHDLNSKSGLLFLVVLHVAILVLSCDHIFVSTALLQVVTSFFWSRPCLWSSTFTGFEFKLRPQCDVTISFDVHFPSSGRNLNSLLQPVSSFQPLFRVTTLR